MRNYRATDRVKKLAEPVARPNVHTNENPEKVSPNALKYKRKLTWVLVLNTLFPTSIHSERTYQGDVTAAGKARCQFGAGRPQRRSIRHITKRSKIQDIIAHEGAGRAKGVRKHAHTRESFCYLARGAQGQSFAAAYRIGQAQGIVTLDNLHFTNILVLFFRFFLYIFCEIKCGIVSKPFFSIECRVGGVPILLKRIR